jgi:glutathione S-transferase
MLQVYGTPFSTPVNKVRYVANYLKIPFEFHSMNLGAGDQRKDEFLKVNPYGKVPAIDDDGFTLGESNAIIRYLANKVQSSIYPTDLKQRALVDQWIDYASMHVMLALSRIMYNTYFYKITGVELDERSLQDGRNFIAMYLPVVEKQLSNNTFIAGSEFTLADIVLLAALDTCELSNVDLTSFTHISTWRNKLMKQSFYTDCHVSFTDGFNKLMSRVTAKA